MLLCLWVVIIRVCFVKISFKFSICKVQLIVRRFKYFSDQALVSQAVVYFLSVRCCTRDTHLAGLGETLKIIQVSFSPYMFAECISHILNVPVPTIINAGYSVNALSFSSILCCFHIVDSYSEFWPFKGSVPMKRRPQLTSLLLYIKIFRSMD